VRFFIVDRGKDDAPIAGIVVCLTGKDGKKYFTGETDAEGFAEVLVPRGQDYELVYLSLGRKDVSAKVSVPDKPRQNLKLTLRYKKVRPAPPEVPTAAPEDEPGFVLEGVEFDTGKATIRPESFPQLDGVLEYLTHKKSARILISGHTDNVGKPADNKRLSQQRAEACKKYLVERGIAADRIEAMGFGDERPLTSNDTPTGKQRNRRIEAVEI
jgi:outer membrane protein OmpA-like peptidoglycan-associated protein